MIGIVSDVHGNDAAFAKAIQILESMGATRFFFLGDAVGYIPRVRAIEILYSMHDRIVCLRGNHEQMLIDGVTDQKKDSIYKISKIADLISDEHIAYINTWKESHSETFPCGKALFVHGSPREPLHEYIGPDTDLTPFHETDTDYVFMGHTHRPFVRQSGPIHFVNIGSCGMPRDCGSLGSAALFDENTGVVRVIRFDIRAETLSILANVDDVHESVLKLYERTDPFCFGERVDER